MVVALFFKLWYLNKAEKHCGSADLMMNEPTINKGAWIYEFRTS